MRHAGAGTWYVFKHVSRVLKLLTLIKELSQYSHFARSSGIKVKILCFWTISACMN